MEGVPTLDVREVYLPWMKGSGGTYLGRGRGTYFGWGREYIPWMGRGHLT